MLSEKIVVSLVRYVAKMSEKYLQSAELTHYSRSVVERKNEREREREGRREMERIKEEREREGGLLLGPACFVREKEVGKAKLSNSIAISQTLIY